MKITRITTHPHQRRLPCIATIGNFDGLHLGHMELFKKTLELSKEKGYKSIVVTFDPDVHSYFHKDKAEHLTTLQERKMLIEEFGFDELILMAFNDELCHTSKDDFVDQYLLKLNIDTLVVGFDFTYGSHPQGYAEDLLDSEINTVVIPELQIDGAKVSSTRIRDLVAKGKLEEVNKLLGRPYFQIGTVVKGNQIGRTMGFPTANVSYEEDKMLLPIGVYAAKIHIDNRVFATMVNIGRKPTIFEHHSIWVEAHILDFDENIYGKTVCLEYLSYLRPEVKFASMEELKEQLRKDVNSTREYFKCMIY